MAVNKIKSFFRKMLRPAKIILPVIFLTVFLLPQIAKAQSTTVNFDQFICLFNKTDANGKCVHEPAESDVRTGAASGLLYGKTDAFDDSGIKAITMQIGLWLDIQKETNVQNKYHFGRVADSSNKTFLIRFKYEPLSGLPVYKLIDVPYQEDDIEYSGGTGVRTIYVDATSNNPSTNKIGFYRTGPSGWETVKQQVVNIKANPGTNISIPFGSKLSADLWYCGGEQQSTRDPFGLTRNPVDGRDAPRGERVEYFTSNGTYRDINGIQSDGIPYGETKCGGTAFYKIGKTIEFTLPANKDAAQIDSNRDLASGIISSEYIGSVLPLCSIDPFTDGSVMGCVAQILYGGVFRPVAFFAQLMGKIFDFFLGYSLSDESYRHDFVQTGWQLVRDISNIFFIIIMIWSGLAAVFGIGSISYKKVIPTLIINALIINFSLFATRIVIDISNITARIFYNQMVVKVNGEVQQNITNKPISEAIVSSFNPQNIFKGSVLQAEDVGSRNEAGSATQADFNSQSSSTVNGAKFQRYSREYASYFALVTLVAIAISFSVAMMFWKTAFMFVGRVVGLYIAMIFSPFAFLSRGGVPLVSKIPSLAFGSWWKDLANYALLAPIFVFFLYIINAFLNVQFFTKIGLEQNGQGFFGSVMYVMIPMLIIYGLVSQGVSVATKLAGKYAQMAQDFATKGAGFVGGAALGVASGGLAFAGTRTAGRLRLSEAKRAALAESRSRGGLSGRIAGLRLRANDNLQTSNFDLRKSKAFDMVSSKVLGGMGVKLNDRVSSVIGLGSDATKGGMKAIEKKEKDELKKKVESIKTDMKDSDAAKFWEERAEKLAKIQEDRFKKDESLVIEAYKALGKTDSEIEAMKASNTLNSDLSGLAKSKIDKDFGRVQNNKQLTQALRLQFADTIAEGKTFGQSAKGKVLKGLGLLGIGGAIGGETLAAASANPLTAVGLVPVMYDSARSGRLEKGEATSYAEKIRKGINNKNKLPKEERLENEKKNIEKELDSIDKTLKDILHQEIKSSPEHKDKTEDEIRRTVEEIFNDPDKSSDAIKNARKKMRETMSDLDTEIELFKAQYQNAASKQAEAKIAGDTQLADKYKEEMDSIKKDMSDKNRKRSEENEKHRVSDPEYKQKKQADLNKKDDELEKIKEKEKKDSAPKDEGKK